MLVWIDLRTLPTNMEAYNTYMAGDEVVIEEFLEGDELSILAFSDGYTVVALPPAQDHKRIFDGDQGPNTGGMGCYAPTRIASKEVLEEVQRTILKPTIDGLRREGIIKQSTQPPSPLPHSSNII